MKDMVLKAQNTALVIVDMENEFCKPWGKYYIGPEVEAVIHNNEYILSTCREKGVFVIFVRSVRYPDNPMFTRFGQGHYLMDGTNGPVIVEELTPRRGEIVVDKQTHDCFYGTTLDSVLDQFDIHPETHTVVVTGVTSNVCVYHAVLGFHVRHYHTVLPLDCTLGVSGAEDFVISQLSSKAYSYNVILTRLNQISVIDDLAVGKT